MAIIPIDGIYNSAVRSYELARANRMKPIRWETDIDSLDTFRAEIAQALHAQTDTQSATVISHDGYIGEFLGIPVFLTEAPGFRLIMRQPNW